MIRPAGLNPYAVWAMNEVGIDISQQTSDVLGDKDLRRYDHFITLCRNARDSCPVLPAELRSEHWDLPDPARIWGTPGGKDERLSGGPIPDRATGPGTAESAHSLKEVCDG